MGCGPGAMASAHPESATVVAELEGPAEICTSCTDLPDTGETATAPPASSADLSDFIEASGLLSYDPAAITRI